MANSNFVVHNGLTVGPLTIDAATGNIATTADALNYSANIIPTTSNLYTLGTSTNWWSSFWGVAINAQYADLAENYVADSDYEPGTVLDFGGEFEVTVCDSVMSSRVAGVVSSNPAYLMNASQPGEIVIPVALTGRTPTKVVGTVKKGDLMVSAGSGAAKAESNPTVGSVIGKALEDFNGNQGVIEVVIGKH